MKLLLTTISSECKSTDLELKYLYNVITDSPVDVQLRTYAENDLYTDIFEDIANGQYNIVYFHADSYNEAKLRHVADMVKQCCSADGRGQVGRIRER